MPIPVRRSDGAKLSAQEGDDHLDYIDRRSPVVVTIASGIITITGPGLYRVETEGGAGTDDLTGIINGLGREWPVILTLNTSGRIITVKHTPPNFLLQNGIDFVLNSVNDSIEFRDRTSVIWRELRRCSVG